MGGRKTATMVLLAAAAGFLGVVGGMLLDALVLLIPGLALVVSSGVFVVMLVLRSAENEVRATVPTPVPPPHQDAAEEARAPRAPIEAAHAPSSLPPEPAGIEPDTVLDAFARGVYPEAAVISAHMWLLDETTRTMRLVTCVGRELGDSEPQPVAGSSIGSAAGSGHALLEPADDYGVERAGAQWRYIVPLRAGDIKGAAVLDLLAAEPDREALNRVAAHLRGALSAALALHVSRGETAAARSLLYAAGELVRLVDHDAINRTALKCALELSGADSGSVMLLDDETGVMRIRASKGLPKQVVAETTVSEGDGIAGWVLATRQSLVVEDLDDKGPNSRRHGIRSAMAVPVMDADGILGVLNVGSRTFHARFSSTHLATLESLGRLLALAHRNASAVASSRELYIDTVKALAFALETKDPYSRGATERVFELAEGLGAAMGLTGSELQALRVAALLHDVGMAAAGDVASLADRPLSTVEWGMLKMHPVISADVLEQAPALKGAVPIVYHHHEHYDGAGYVVGLSGEQIPLGARILSVADAYVSMTSPRPYRPAYSHEQAMGELAEKAGSQFDPTVVQALVDLFETVTSRP